MTTLSNLLRFCAFALILSHLLLACALANPSKLVELGSDENFYQPLASHVSYYIDDTLELSAPQLIRQLEKFEPLSRPIIGFGVIPSRIWLTVEIINPAQMLGQWRLDINHQFYPELDVYLLHTDQQLNNIFSYRQQQNFQSRPFADRKLAVDLQLASREQATLLISYRAQSSSFMPLAIGTVAAVTQGRENENTLNWATNGALLAIIAFSLMLTAVIGWRLSTSFALYIFAGTFFVFHSDGYAFQYLWPNQLQWYEPLHLSFMLFMPILGLQFARTLFDFKQQAPLFDRVITGYMVIALCVSLCSAYLYQNQSLWIVAYYVVPIGSLLQLASGILATHQRQLGWQPYLVGTIIVISPFFYAVASYLNPGQFNSAAALDFTHLSLLGECLAFAAAITIRLLGVRSERDQAVAAELASTQERLKLTSDLQRAQDDYISARKLSDMRRTQLSSVSHDLQQPLTSLRLALNGLRSTDEDARQQMHSAFDYLESLAQEHLSKPDEFSQAGSGKNADLEIFPIRIVLDNVYKMFKDEAVEKGLTFRYRPIEADVRCDPVSLMRAINNLVANAIQHTATGAILLAARRHGDKVLVQVWDSGSGLNEDEIKEHLQPYHKGQDSQGHGLGLGIVQAFSDQLNLNFEFRSRPDKGSVATLYLHNHYN